MEHFELAICFRELLIVAGTGAVSRFVSENEQGQSDINTVSSTHVETVVLLSKGMVDNRKVKVDFSLEDMDLSEFKGKATYE